MLLGRGGGARGELVKFINEQIPMFLNLMTLC